ncbi:uncharacterized protein FA14DRAFT_177889 [Meira miltonrushii]|uniref:Centromere protein H C-terminal domain-containing protein n=1 Tax=Meira miltonrushii TaxID=1280837 RepID=A0A316VAH4_9BASI|nr:uncharacterized protein FA14DRAFT_177889 [Meira miltonrushii]PWN34482.1 hypothetical protein FA14DRAFT_177889 [Meira miltonrushii]
MENLSIGESSRSTVSLVRDIEDDDVASGQTDNSSTLNTSYLTPLQQSLVFELTTRRKRIAKAQRRIEFWERYEEKQAKEKQAGKRTATDQFERDVVDEEYLDDLIKQRKDRLAELQQSQTLKESIMESADAAHSINASMAAVPPGPFPNSPDISLCPHDIAPERQPIRSLVARRDEAALKFLQLDDQIKRAQRERYKILGNIQAARETTANLYREIHELKEALARKKTDELDISNSVTIDRQEDAQARIAALQRAINTARGKREMVKGVLRGLILESGLDWSKNKGLRKLVLQLGDDEVYSSDEDVDLYTDEEETEESSDEGED